MYQRYSAAPCCAPVPQRTPDLHCHSHYSVVLGRVGCQLQCLHQRARGRGSQRGGERLVVNHQLQRGAFWVEGLIAVGREPGGWVGVWGSQRAGNASSSTTNCGAVGSGRKCFGVLSASRPPLPRAGLPMLTSLKRSRQISMTAVIGAPTRPLRSADIQCILPVHTVAVLTLHGRSVPYPEQWKILTAFIASRQCTHHHHCSPSTAGRPP